MAKTVVDENGDFVSGPILRIGGLFRCCVQTWQEEVGGTADDVNRIVCKHCKESMVRDEEDPNIWGWKSQLSVKAK